MSDTGRDNLKSVEKGYFSLLCDFEVRFQSGDMERSGESVLWQIKITSPLASETPTT